MAQLPTLSEAFVRQHLPYRALVDRLSETFIRLLRSKEPGAENSIRQPLRTSLPNHDNSGFFMSMPSYAAAEGVFATKLVTLFHGNTDLPSHQGVIVLLDGKNGKPLVVMGAEEVTGRRTAAASALASLHLARSDSSCLAVLGAGTQAETHIEAHLAVMPGLRRVQVWNRTRSRADRLVSKLRSRTGNSGVVFEVFDTVKDTVRDADIVCTVTSATTPVLNGDWLTRPGVHVNAVGAPNPKWRELESNVLTRSFLVADARESAEKESGDVIASGKTVDAELSQIIDGKVKVDRNNRATVFKSLGIALEDLAAAKMVYEAMNSDPKGKL